MIERKVYIEFDGELVVKNAGITNEDVIILTVTTHVREKKKASLFLEQEWRIYLFMDGTQNVIYERGILAKEKKEDA